MAEPIARYRTEYKIAGEWTLGAYYGPDRERAVDDCRKVWQRTGVTGVRVLREDQWIELERER